MAKDFDRIPCPFCGGVFGLEEAWNDADGRRFIETITALPPAVIRPLYRYLKLFKPEKQTLRWSRVLALTQELAPLIKAAQVKRNGIIYAVPLENWVNALTSLVDNPPETLVKPLKKNAYLLSMLANQAEKAAAQMEEKVEQQRRNRGGNGADKGPRAIGHIAQPPPQKKTPPPDWRPKSIPTTKNKPDE